MCSCLTKPWLVYVKSGLCSPLDIEERLHDSVTSTVFGTQVSSVYVHYDTACTLPFCFVYLIFEIQGYSAYFDSATHGLAEGAQAA